MADEETTTEKQTEGTEETGEAPEPPRKRRLPRKLIVLVALLGVLGAGGFFGVKKFTAPPGEKPPPKVGEIVEMEEFLVNLYQSGNFLKCTVALGLEEGAKPEEMESRMPLVRDVIVMILTSKGEADVATPEGKLALKAEIRDAVNIALGEKSHDGPANNTHQESDGQGTPGQAGPGGVERNGPKSGGRSGAPEGPVLEVYFTAFAMS